MKKQLVITVFFLSLILFINSNIKKSHTQSTTPPPAHTGAVGEETCVSCHADNAPNTIINLLVDDGVTEYVPGHNYTMELTVDTDLPDPSVYGFQITARNISDEVVGEWISTSNNTIALQQGDYLTHFNTTAANSGNGFQFEWNSPFPGAGPVSFYVSAVAGNDDGTADGDAVANVVQVFQQDPATLEQHDYWVSMKVFLEGFYDEETGGLKTDMADDGLVPLSQPFAVAPYYYYGTESVTEFPPGTVDWILLEARNGIPSLSNPGTETIEMHAALLMEDGRIMDLDGVSPVYFETLQPDCFYYFVVRHRSHLDIFTAEATSTFYPIMAYDFTNSSDKAYGTNQLKPTEDGMYTMIAGDYDGNGTINSNDYNMWRSNNAVVFGYVPWDADANGIVNNIDYNLWYINRGKICCSEVEF